MPGPIPIPVAMTISRLTLHRPLVLLALAVFATASPAAETKSVVQARDVMIFEQGPEDSAQALQDELHNTAEPDGAAAAKDGCPSCRGFIPVCRRVPLTIKKPKVEYRMKCELVCVPGCGCLKHGGRGGCDRCSHGECGDARIRQKKLLLKEVTEEERQSYEYKIFWVCPACAGFGGSCTDDPERHPRGHGSDRRVASGLLAWPWLLK